MRFREVALALAVWFLCLPAAGAPGTRNVVEVTVAGESGDLEFEERLSSWFDTARFQVTVRPSTRITRGQILSPAAPDVLFVWVIVHPRSVHLYFSRAALGGSQPVYLTRRLSLSSGFDEVAAERTAQVVHLSSLALLEGQDRTPPAEILRHLEAEAPGTLAAGADSGEGSLTRTEATASLLDAHADGPLAASALAPAPPAIRHVVSPAAAGRGGAMPVDHAPRGGHSKGGRARPLPLVHAGVGYGLGHRYDEGFAHGPRVSLELDWALALRPRLSAQTFMPARSELDRVSLEVYGAGFSVAASVGAEMTRGFYLHVFGGPGFHLIRYRAYRSADFPILSTEQSHVEARPVLELGVGAVVGTRYPRVALVAQLAAALTRTRYAVMIGDERVDVARGPDLVPMTGVEVRF